MPILIQRLQVEPMTEAAFSPYGVLLAPLDGIPPDYRDADSEGWRHVVELEGSAELIVSRTRYVGLRFSRLERHHAVTQAFIPLGGVAAAVAVAPATGSEPPPPHAVVAFLLRPGTGYLLHRGTWHSLDRYPLGEGAVDVVMLTERETTDEATTVRKVDWCRTDEVDYVELCATQFELVPPG